MQASNCSEQILINEDVPIKDASKQKLDFAMLRIENDIKEYQKNSSPTQNCITQISTLQTNCDLPKERTFQQGLPGLRPTRLTMNDRDENSVLAAQQFQTSIGQIIGGQQDSSLCQQSQYLTQQNSKPLGRIIIETKVVGGIYKNYYFQFQMYFMSKYPYSPPKVYLSHLQTPNKIPTKPLFVDPLNNEVQLKILNEEWSPVLSLQMIILALELQIGEDSVNEPSPLKGDVSNQDFQNQFYELQRSQSKQQHPCQQMSSFIDQQSNKSDYASSLRLNETKKRKLNKISRDESNEAYSSEEVEGSKNPVKRLRRVMDDLSIQSPASTQHAANIVNPKIEEEDDACMEITA